MSISRINTMFSIFYTSLIILISVIPSCRTEFVEDLIQAQNFTSETHTVRTKDGYILPLYRIPPTNIKPNGKIVLLQHPLTCSASCFLMFGRDSAAYFFAELGYDVWLGNNRGTRFARKHDTMSPEEPEFWDFSWHELGVYDLPAIIDYILELTNSTKLSYVGHSQSVTTLFVLLAEMPQYNEKITVAHLLTPTVYFKYVHPINSLYRSMKMILETAEFFKSMNMYEMVPFNNFYRTFMKSLADYCTSKRNDRDICRKIYYFISGPSKHIYNEFLNQVLDHVPAGASYKQFIHYTQNFWARSFRQYHHGEEKNMQIYGSTEPPKYNLTNVRANIHMLYGTTDLISPAQNIPPLNKALGRKIAVLSKFEGYSHIDFAYAKLDKVYGKILRVDKLFD